MDIMKLYGFLFRVTGTREKRMALFNEIMQPSDGDTIIDIGGTPRNWAYLEAKPKVTLVNQQHNGDDVDDDHDTMLFETGDATDLRHPSGSFDIAFSNSVIEHLHDRENQERFVAEATRVADRLWVQTPAREFFLELHLITPFVHWLPVSIQRRLLRNFTVWGIMNRPSADDVDALLDELVLLRRHEFEALFPGCEFHVERWLGMPKSYIAYRR